MSRERKGITENGEVYDIETGEFRDGHLVFVPRKDKSQFGQDFFLMAQNTFSFLADNRKMLGGEGFAVFGKLISRLDFENYIQVSQADIAKELDMKRPNVSRAIKRLCDLGIIGRGPKVGTAYTYRLHPAAGWKGKPRAHFTALQEAKARGWKVIETQPELPF